MKSDNTPTEESVAPGEVIKLETRFGGLSRGKCWGKYFPNRKTPTGEFQWVSKSSGALPLESLSRPARQRPTHGATARPTPGSLTAYHRDNMSTKSNQPNYRIYDHTGSGVTEDIYAESLEDAIQQGREWIESADWDALNYEQTLPCAVAEIVRDEDGDIDDDATWEATRHDCSGTLAAKDAPECSAGEHDWRSPFSLVGGIKENPGVWGSGHGQVSTKEVCACCGIYRTIDYGATESATGQKVTTTDYEPADDASRALLDGPGSQYETIDWSW